MKPLPTVNQAFNIILTEEKQRKCYIPMHSETIALSTSQTPNVGNDYTENVDNTESNYIAQLENLQGQVEQLRTMIGKGQSKENSSGTKLDHMAGMLAITSHSVYSVVPSSFHNSSALHSSTHSTTSWIIDSGATDHMCNGLRLMHTIHSIDKPIFVTLPTCELVKVTLLGSVNISPDLTLVDVLYTPSFKFNLLSISKVTSTTPCSVVFNAHGCEFQDQTVKKQIASGEILGGLYNFKSQCFAGIAHKLSSEIWHKRLGHPSLHIQKLLSHNLVPCSVDSSHCTICPLSKQHRLSFPVSSSNSSSLFQLVH